MKPVYRNTPWWKVGRDRWPIETWEGKPIKSLIRIIVQNFRKFTGI